MIASLYGFVESVTPEYMVLNVNDIGYQLFCPNPFVYETNAKEKVKIFTYHYVREDVIALYGFKKLEERNLFTRLLQVSGIGPKGALAILASGKPEQVIAAIEEEDEKFLIKFPGVGKKTARQMILDLKGKLQDLVDHDSNIEKAKISRQSSPSHLSHELEEATEALRVLGYAEREIQKVIPPLSEKELTTDQYVKQALQMLLNGG